MRESSPRRSTRFAGRSKPGRQADNLFQSTRHQLLFATVLGLGAMLWVHGLSYAGDGPWLAHAPYLGLDILLAVPIAGAAIWAADRLRHRLQLGDRLLVRSAVVAVVFTAFLVPLAALQGFSHGLLGAAGAGHHHTATDLAGLAGYGLTTALQAWPAVLVAALIGAFGQRLLAEPRLRRRTVRWLLGSRRPLTAVSAAGVMLATLGVVTVLPASPAAAQTGSCATAPKRTFNVSAINVTITVNRHGDNDPYGYMYALDENLAEIEDFENKLDAASRAGSLFDPVTGAQLRPDPNWPELIYNDPNATYVSNGLDQDPIQPLVLRARLGECVVVNFTNRLTRAPVTGITNRLIQLPGGVPSVSVDMQGVTYDAAGGQGGQDVGNNAPAMADPPAPGAPGRFPAGETEQYRFFIDPLMGESTKVFRSGGESAQLTAHGLFGALIAEPAGAKWFDPDTGQERTNDNTWSNWEAMIQAPGEPTFREFTILYHEVGDETYTLRRPLREAFGGQTNPRTDPFDPTRQIGGALPMIDRRDPDNPQALDAFRRGASTHGYRPSGRALNYRSESFFRRLQHETLIVGENGGGVPEALREQTDNKSLAYSSYTYGDPATPIAESYLGEPTKTRLAHVGFEQLHVHHLHGGADRWRQNPNADDTDMDSGLRKVPIQNAKSIRLDSQTISPQESFNLEHECGAGGCQQSVGDFLYHCHIAHHYIAGMWGIWRVFNTAQEGLAALPGDAKPAAGVTSAQLLGRKIEGKTVVVNVTNPNTQIALADLVEASLPPQGARLDKHDATVWDWVVSGPANAPVYLSEPDYGDVTLAPPFAQVRSWENYRSDTPGQRPPILFDPTNGRPAYPMLQPHLVQRPPFAPREHSGAPYLGDTVNNNRPDGLCPATSPVREYNITAVTVDIQMTPREVDPAGMLFFLNDEFTIDANGNAVPVPSKAIEPLAIRSNVGDCVAITFSNRIDTARTVAEGFEELAKTNMHTHFVQFDIQGSDGVIVGFNYETSVFPSQRDGRELASPVNAGSSTATVNHVNQLRPGIAIAVGGATADIEIRTIASISGTTLTFDRPLGNSHPAGVPVTVEFTQHRWYSDVDSGTVFWHDHVDGILSWAHGLFAAHIIEPRGSTYHDPVTGAQVDSGAVVDIRNSSSNASVGVGQSGSFREYMLWLHNGRPGSPITEDNARGNKFGQECEEGSINLRAAPVGERTPPGTLITNPADGDPLDVDPSTTMQRFEFNGFFECRNSFDRTGASGTNLLSTAATVTAVDPYVFSSVKYGDPDTPLLRAYLGDDVVIRTIGLGERAEGLRFQGHRFRMERFNTDGQLMDTAVTGISERFDYVLDGGAGGPAGKAGDYLYYSARTFALESGAWGIFRVHDTLQNGLQPLPDNTPASGSGFPILSPNTASNPQANPGPNPPAPSSGNVSDGTDACPRGQIPRIYSITAFDHTLPSAPFADTEGVVYALTADVAAIQSGAQAVEPLVLRVNQGDCVVIRLRNRIQSQQNNDPDVPSPGSLYGGTRAGFDLGLLLRNPQTSGGAAVGLNPDTTVAAGQDGSYTFYADVAVGTTVFQNLGSLASVRHGGWGMLIVEPAGSRWFDNETGVELGSTETSTAAVIDPPGTQPSFREFAVGVQSTDQQYSRSVIPYMDVVAGIGINPHRNAGGQPELRTAPIAGAPPGTRDTNGSYNKAFNHVNYHTAPLTSRIGLTAGPGHLGDGQPGWFDPGFVIANPYGTAFSSGVHGDPDTPVFRARTGDPVVFRVGVGGSDQLHSFTVSGHMFPLEPTLWTDASDHRSQLMSARTITAGQTLNAELVGGAGGTPGHRGDYAFLDSRQPFAQAGMWGILRVQANNTGIVPIS
jgi:hypothetical protein